MGASSGARWAWVVLAICVSACGRMEYELLDGATVLDASALDASATDASAPDASAPDAGPPGDGGVDRCRWSAPAIVSEIATADGEYQPTTTADGLRLCFTSDRGPRHDPNLYCTSRASTGAAWGTARPQTMLNTGVTERMPALSPDGSELFFSTDRLGDEDIYRATWNATLGEYDVPLRVDELSSTVNDAGPEVAPDGLTLYFHRRAAAGALEIVVAQRSAAGMPFTITGAIASLDSAEDDGEPALSPDGQTLVFCSTRPIAGSPAGTSALWCAGRWGSGWLAPVPVEVPGLAGAGACSPAIDRDGALLFNAGLLAGGVGGSDVYRSPR